MRHCAPSPRRTLPYDILGESREEGKKALFLNNLIMYVASHATPLLIMSMLLILILLILVIYTLVRLSAMNARYREMMRGSKSRDLEGMLLQHIQQVEKVSVTNERIVEENKRLRKFVQKTLVRVAMVRFRAFEDMGGDLSYAVAMLDANNDGLIFSSIFARADSRSYIKPIKGGHSEYPLTDEEKGVLREAMEQPLPIQY